MCHETIVLADGRRITGRLVDHIGGGRVIITVGKRRYAGVKASTAERRAAR